jgi:hypothetical protein
VNLREVQQALSQQEREAFRLEQRRLVERRAHTVQLLKNMAGVALMVLSGALLWWSWAWL